jgi:hypothetical protein
VKDKNRELLIEIKGKLDGIAYCVDGGADDALWEVIELLDAILEDEKNKRKDKKENGKREV